MTRIFSVTSLTPHNLGDEVSCPFDYLLKDLPVERVDIAHIERLPAGSTIILGGGGLLHSIWIDCIRRVVASEKHRLISWAWELTAISRLKCLFQNTYTSLTWLGSGMRAIRGNSFRVRRA